MILQPSQDLLRSLPVGQPYKLIPQLLEPYSSQWALKFDEAGYIQASNEENFDFEYDQPWSLYCKFQHTADSVTTSPIILGKQQQGGFFRGYGIYYAQDIDVITVDIRTTIPNRIIVNSTATLFDATWYDLIVTYDGSGNANGVNICLDNIPGQTIIANNLGAGSILNDVPFQLGARAGGNRLFNGIIERAAVFNRVLNESEKNQLILGMVPTIGQIAYWRFQEGFGVADGTVIRDWSGQNNHGNMQDFNADPWINIGIR